MSGSFMTPLLMLDCPWHPIPTDGSAGVPHQTQLSVSCTVCPRVGLASLLAAGAGHSKLAKARCGTIRAARPTCCRKRGERVLGAASSCQPPRPSRTSMPFANAALQDFLRSSACPCAQAHDYCAAEHFCNTNSGVVPVQLREALWHCTGRLWQVVMLLPSLFCVDQYHSHWCCACSLQAMSAGQQLQQPTVSAAPVSLPAGLDLSNLGALAAMLGVGTVSAPSTGPTSSGAQALPVPRYSIRGATPEPAVFVFMVPPAISQSPPTIPAVVT